MNFTAPWGNYLLKSLTETQAPNAINWWPQTIGWKILFFVSVIYVGFKVYYLIKKYRHNAYRRKALAWLQSLPPYQVNDPDIRYQKLPSVLRKVALSAYKREDVCTLSNKLWLQWLDQQCDKTNFSKVPTFVLNQLAYIPAYDIDTKVMESLVNEITLWIKYHRGQYD